jgi:WD40 repeat protein
MIEGLLQHSSYKMACPCGCKVNGHAITKEREVIIGNKKRMVEVKVTMDYKVEVIPESVLGSDVAKFVTNRYDFDELRVVGKGVYMANKGVLPPWPCISRQTREASYMLAFSPDSRTLLTGARDGQIQLLNRIDCSYQYLNLPQQWNYLSEVVFTEDGDGQYIVMIRQRDSDYTCFIQNITNGSHRSFVLLIPNWRINCYFCISRDGKHVAGCDQEKAYLWDVATGECIQTKDIILDDDDLDNNLICHCVVSDGQVVACALSNGKVAVLEMKNEGRQETLRHNYGNDDELFGDDLISKTEDMIFSPDGNYLFVSYFGEHLRVWNISDWTFTQSKIPEIFGVVSIPDNDSMVVAISNTQEYSPSWAGVKLFWVPKLAYMANLPEGFNQYEYKIVSLAVSPDLSGLVTGHLDGWFDLRSVCCR